MKVITMFVSEMKGKVASVYGQNIVVPEPGTTIFNFTMLAGNYGWHLVTSLEASDGIILIYQKEIKNTIPVAFSNKDITK